MNYFRWENPESLLLLALLPIFWVLIFLFRKQKKQSILKMGNKELIESQSTYFSLSWANHLRWVIYSFVLICIIIGLANPQIGLQKEVLKREGIDIAIALDISKSMLVQDLKPSRLERAKQFTSKLLDNLSSDRVAFIVFAGNAYTQMPLTADHTAARMFLSSISTDLAPTQGTAVSEAIETSLSTFQEGAKTSKAIIVITDGEDHEGNVEEAINKARTDGCKIYSVGAGTAEGGPIPNYENGQMQGFVKDNQGNTVISKLESGQLGSMASQSGGKAYRLGQSNDILEALVNDLGKLKKTNMESKEFRNYNSFFQWMLIPALFLMVIEALIPFVKQSISIPKISTVAFKKIKTQ